MPQHGLLVIGSGPGGVAAATAYRAAGADGPVTLVSADPDPPYERPPLSKDVLRGESRPDDVYLHPAAFYADQQIDLHLNSRVRALGVEDQIVRLQSGAEVGYDTCVLATGSAPVRPPIPGAGLPCVHVLRSRVDGIALRDAASRAGRVVVAGSGFIGCEAAASLAARGLDVVLVTTERRPQQARLGSWAGDRIADWLRAVGVELVTEDRIAEVSADRDTRVRTAAGRTVRADLVLLAVGVRPQGELAAAAGLRVHDGRVRVDASMRSSAPQVLAVGDVALAHNASAGRAIAVEHWGDALTMGEIAGQVAAGDEAQWSQAPGFWSTIGDHTLKYAAWGDGFDGVDLDGDESGRFAVRYTRAGHPVGVLTHQDDAAYERGQQLVEAGAPG